MNKLFLVAAAVVVVIASWLTYYFTREPTSADNTPAVAAPAVVTITKEEVQLTKIQAYKQRAKTKLPLPQQVKDDKAEHVVAATQTPDDGHKHIITTVVNEDTGKATTFDYKEPLPWFTLEKKNELRLDYGFKGSPFPQPVARLSYRVDLIQVKALHFGLNSSLDFDGEYFIGGGVGWKF